MDSDNPMRNPNRAGGFNSGKGKCGLGIFYIFCPVKQSLLTESSYPAIHPLTRQSWTGESLPVDKGAGDSVCSGTVNQFGSFDMKAVKVGEDSSIQRMIRLVQSADAGKAKIVSLANRWATWIVVIALTAAEYVAGRLHIDSLFSDCLPEDKLEHIEDYQKNGKKVCMIGDGINDAPAQKKHM